MQEGDTTTAHATGKGALRFVVSVVMMDAMELGLRLPTQAYVVRQYINEALMVALIPMLSAAAKFFAAPLPGKLSDRLPILPSMRFCCLHSPSPAALSAKELH